MTTVDGAFLRAVELLSVMTLSFVLGTALGLLLVAVRL